jgi:isoamylase
MRIVSTPYLLGVTDGLRATYSGHAMSQTHSAEHGILGEDMLRTVPQRDDQLSLVRAASVGRSAPLGATVSSDGVNFSLYSRNASGIELLFFDHEDDGCPSHVIRLDPTTNRSYHYWHVFVPGLRVGQLYGYRVHGPFDPTKGFRFDPTKVLLDPYGRGVAVPRNYSREAARQEGDNAATAMKSLVVDPSLYDWEGDTPLRRPSSQTIVYEMHVKGFTRHPNSGVPEPTRGSYRGLIQKIPYLRDLGVSAVELLPVFQFDPQDCPPGRVNYWGYAPVSFFAPHQAYSSRQDPLGAVDEFRDMVKSLHRAGIEVILDVVFNHTAEGDHLGPTLSFRGLDNGAYYLLENDRSRYANYSGTGNTLNANHSIVRRMIVDSLRYWVEEMHVDGFRFDLASILARDSAGQVMSDPPVLWDIESDPVLAGTKMIAEAWDAAGLYQVGSFVGDSWKEWNGRFRDDVRSFFRGDEGSLRVFADRLLGSHEIYRHEEREAEQSVNFVACHDGFTLNDLVSYNQKHNEGNGEENRDGSNDDRSWNCGVEGPTTDAEVERLRTRQVKNFMTVTMLSLGLPMFLMGDEVRRTQHGNNNAYCQDNEENWFDWSLLVKHADVHRFVKLLVARRLRRDTGPERQRMTLIQLIREGVKGWHGIKLNQPDWSDHSHSIALSAELTKEDLLVHFIFNAYWEPLDFDLPTIGLGKRGAWRRWIDTFQEAPEDIVAWQEAPTIPDSTYRAGPRSVVVLWANLADGAQQA